MTNDDIDDLLIKIIEITGINLTKEQEEQIRQEIRSIQARPNYEE